MPSSLPKALATTDAPFFLHAYTSLVATVDTLRHYWSGHAWSSHVNNIFSSSSGFDAATIRPAFGVNVGRHASPALGPSQCQLVSQYRLAGLRLVTPYWLEVATSRFTYAALKVYCFLASMPYAGAVTFAIKVVITTLVIDHAIVITLAGHYC